MLFIRLLRASWVRSVLLLLILAVASGCGSNDATSSAEQESEQEGTTDGADESDETNETDETDAVTSQWIRIETDSEVGQYQPAQPVEVLAHPNKEQAILVRFMMAQPPCSGARVRTAESATAIAVALEVGLHNNVAAMSCLAGEGRFELEIELEAPVANRTVQTVGAQTDSATESTTSTETGSTTSQSESTETPTTPSDSTETTTTEPPVETGPPDPPSSDVTADLIGRTIEEASARAIDRGLTVRVMRLDGEDLIGTLDYRTDRINVEVTDGVVVAILGIG